MRTIPATVRLYAAGYRCRRHAKPTFGSCIDPYFGVWGPDGREVTPRASTPQTAMRAWEEAARLIARSAGGIY